MGLDIDHFYSWNPSEIWNIWVYWASGCKVVGNGFMSLLFKVNMGKLPVCTKVLIKPAFTSICYWFTSVLPGWSQCDLSKNFLINKSWLGLNKLSQHFEDDAWTCCFQIPHLSGMFISSSFFSLTIQRFKEFFCTTLKSWQFWNVWTNLNFCHQIHNHLFSIYL